MNALNKILAVWFRTRCLGQSTQDEELTKKVILEEKMESGAARVTRELMTAQTQPLRRLHKQVGKYIKTTSFEGFGMSRLIVAAAQPRIDERMRAFQQQHDKLVAEFVEHYPEHLVAEKVKHGTRFRASDYPPVEQVAEKFHVDWGFAPMAQPSQFQESVLSAEIRDQLQAQYEAQSQAAIAGIEAESIRRILAMVSDVATELAKDKPVLVDSENRKGVIPRLREAIDLLPENDLTGNPTIAALHAVCKEKLTLATEFLKNSEFARRDVVTAAESILAQFGGLGQRMVEAA
jgi:hypothetical protein